MIGYAGSQTNGPAYARFPALAFRARLPAQRQQRWRLPSVAHRHHRSGSRSNAMGQCQRSAGHTVRPHNLQVIGTGGQDGSGRAGSVPARMIEVSGVARRAATRVRQDEQPGGDRPPPGSRSATDYFAARQAQTAISSRQVVRPQRVQVTATARPPPFSEGSSGSAGRGRIAHSQGSLIEALVPIPTCSGWPMAIPPVMDSLRTPCGVLTVHPHRRSSSSPFRAH